MSSLTGLAMGNRGNSELRSYDVINVTEEREAAFSPPLASLD